MTKIDISVRHLAKTNPKTCALSIAASLSAIRRQLQAKGHPLYNNYI